MRVMANFQMIHCMQQHEATVRTHRSSAFQSSGLTSAGMQHQHVHALMEKCHVCRMPMSTWQRRAGS